jgi:hypothetical protein
MAALSRLVQLELLDLRSVKGFGLQHLAGLGRLESLDLRGCFGFTDACLQHLDSLSSLRALYIDCAEVSGRGMQALSHLTTLEVLSLTGCDFFGSVGFQAVVSLGQLWGLRMEYYDDYDTDCYKLTDADLAALVIGLVRLEGLSIGCSAEVTDTGLQHLTRLTSLTTLELDLSDCCRVTDTGLRPVVGLNCLTKLHISPAAQVTSEYVQVLARIRGLELCVGFGL